MIHDVQKIQDGWIVLNGAVKFKFIEQEDKNSEEISVDMEWDEESLTEKESNELITEFINTAISGSIEDYNNDV
jgi:hypothetical protein